MRIETQLATRASVDRVWALTEDVESWPSITPTITSVERLDDGPLRIGSTARIKQPRQRPTVWTVTRLEPPRLFEWQTKVLSITMTGGHRLDPIPDGCRNTLSIELTGFGSGFMGRVLGRKLREAIETENRGFKARAESADSANG